MAKGSVRKKGSKWYYRFYVEDESGKLVQREFAGTASKSETEAMLRKAMEDYEAKKFVAKSENVTVGQLLDMWVEEELKPGSLSNGTVSAYQGTVGRIKQFPIGERKLKTVTPEHLQSFLDLLSFGGMDANGKEVKPISKGYMRLFSAVLQGAFRFAVFPKRLLSYNPMQYVVMRKKQESYELFSDDNSDELAHGQPQFRPAFSDSFTDLFCGEAVIFCHRLIHLADVSIAHVVAVCNSNLRLFSYFLLNTLQNELTGDSRLRILYLPSLQDENH